jgi:hypothetical protein
MRAPFDLIDRRVVFRLEGPKGGFDRVGWSELAVCFESLCTDHAPLAALSVMQRQA